MASLEEGQEGGPRRISDGPKGRNGVREGADCVNRHPTASSRPNDGTRRRAVVHPVLGGVAAPSCSRWEEDPGGIRPARPPQRGWGGVGRARRTPIRSVT